MDDLEQQIRIFVGGDQVHAVLAAILIIAITAVISHFVTKLLRKLGDNQRVRIPTGSIFINIARVIVWTIGICLMSSSCFGVDVTGVVAALGVGGIALSLGLKDTISNLIGGMQISILGIVQPGDNVKVGVASGVVEDVSWRQTTVRDESGNVFIVPNAVINASTVEKSAPAGTVAVALVVDGNGADLDEVAHRIESSAKTAIERVSALDLEPFLLFDEILEGGVHAKLVFRVADADKVRQARDAALRAVAPFTRQG